MLFVRRTLWLPSWSLLVGLLLLCVALSYWGITRAAYFLALNEPLGEGVLIVEGWLDEPHLVRALYVYRSGSYQALITTGGPIQDGCEHFDDYATSALERLRGLGLSGESVYAVPSPASARDRTWQDAITLRDWLAGRDIQPAGIDIFTGHVHARRSRDLYREAFAGQLRVGVISSPALRFEYRNWWATSEGAKITGIELLAWVHTRLLGNRG